MDITKLIVSYQETANLGNYSNVKPSATIEVALSEGDDPEAAFAEATATVRRIVQREVDDALEASDQEPKYTTEPRYAVFVRNGHKKNGLPTIAIIAPADADYGPHLSRSYRGYRIPATRRLAWRHYKNGLIVDTTVEPDALAPVLEQIAAEEAVIAEERERERQQREREHQEWRRKYEAPSSVEPDNDEDEDDEEG